MLDVKLDEVNSVAVLVPEGALSKEDFVAVAAVIDSYIEKTGQLKGLVIHTESFPGWDSFAALASHLKFVKEHHKQIARIAFATDSVVGNIAEAIASHFVNAEIKGFSYQELEQARDWVAENP